MAMVSDGTVLYKSYLTLSAPSRHLTHSRLTRDRAEWGVRSEDCGGQKQNNFRFLNPIISGSSHLIELLTCPDKRGTWPTNVLWRPLLFVREPLLSLERVLRVSLCLWLTSGPTDWHWDQMSLTSRIIFRSAQIIKLTRLTQQLWLKQTGGPGS